MWYVAFKKDYQFTLNAYKTIHSLGTFNQSDGVKVLIKDSLNTLQIEKQVILNCNSIHFKIKSNELTFFIVCIYRSPNDNVKLFIKSLDFLLYQINN